jgi:hypothetical protein
VAIGRSAGCCGSVDANSRHLKAAQRHDKVLKKAVGAKSAGHSRAEKAASIGIP